MSTPAHIPATEPVSEDIVAGHVSWSPDGQALAYQAGGNIYTVHVGSIANGCSSLGAPRLLVRSGTSPSWGPR